MCNGDIGVGLAKTGTVTVTNGEKELAWTPTPVGHKIGTCWYSFNGVGYMVTGSLCNLANEEQPVMLDRK